MTDAQRAALEAIEAAASAIDVAAGALAESARVLRESLTPPPVEPPPAPPPPVEPPAEPPAEPPVEPPAPEPSARPAAIVKPINRAAALVFRDWVVRGGRYSRWQEVARLTDGGVTILANATALDAGGGVLGLQSDSYTLTIDGNPVSTASVTPGAKVDLSFSFDPVTIPSGWHVMDIVPASGAETCVPMPALVPPRDGDPLPEWMPVWNGGYEVAVSGHPARIDWAPAQFAPTELPLAPREYTPFDTALHRSNLSIAQIVPARSGYIHRPVMTAEGVLASANVQWYTVGDFVAKTPRVPLLDGPRGRGLVGFPSHIQIGVGTFSADPSSAPMNNLYVAHPWGVVRVSDSGHITTLFGLRHPGIASYWEDPSNVELVGDFTQADNLAPHEIWGFAWDSASLVVDTTHPPIPSELGRQPHAGTGPFMAVADSQNDRLLGVQFDPKAHGIPPVVTVIARLQDPWMVVEWGDSWIVSERKAHRIVQISKATSEIERVIVQGQALAAIDHSRLVQRLAALDVLRAEPCVAPEGLDVWGDWLYFTSIAQRDVRRVHLVTGELQIVVPNVATSRNFFLNLAVSKDGTFGPPGTMFVTDWQVTNFGFPLAYLPDGSAWSLTTYSGSASIPVGPGGVFESFGYSAAVGVRAGRMVFGGAGEGLIELRRTPPGMPAVNGGLYNQGATRWVADGLHLRYGPNGWGYHGEPLPWGYSPETDYCLTVHGHAQG